MSDLMGGSVFDGMYRLRREFLRVGLEVPAAIILSNPEQGRRFLSEADLRCLVPEGIPTPKPVEHPDGSIWMEIEVVGIKVRWPGNRVALESGGYVWR